MKQLPTRYRWEKPAERVHGERLLKARQVQQRVADAAIQAKAEAQAVEKQAEKSLAQKVDELDENIDRLIENLPRMIPAAGGGRRTIKKVLRREYNLPDGIGSAAGADVEDFATAQQGDLADTSLQPGENLSDLADDATARANLGLGTSAVAALLDDDEFTADSATAVPSQQSVKAYIDNFNLPTRAALVSLIGSGWPVINGRVFRAGGFEYIGSTGATAIPDLPGLLPNGDVYVQHFGAVADMTWELQEIRGPGGVLQPGVFAPVRTGGTSQRAPIQLASDYAESAKKILHFKDGNYYVQGQITQRATWLPETDGVTLWCEYAKVPDPTPGSSLEITECGIVVEGHNVCLGIPGFKGFQIIGQCNPNSGKEPNGARGLIVRFGSDYYVKTEPTIWQGQKCRIWVCRAAAQRDAGGTLIQHSIGAISVGAFGGHDRPEFEIGTFSQTSISGQYLFLYHWAAWYDPALIKATGQLNNLVGGSGYAGNFAVTSLGGGGGLAIPMSGTAQVTAGAVTGIVWDDLGDWPTMTARPTIDWSAGSGTGASATLVYGDTETHSKGLAIPTYTYHGVYGKLRFLNRIDAAKHEYSSPYEIAAGWGWTIDNPQTINFPFSTTYDYGGGLGVISCGDLCAAFVNPAQRGLEGLTTTVLNPVAYDCASTVATSEQLLIKGLGTSGAWGDFEPGSRVKNMRQAALNVDVYGARVNYKSGTHDPKAGPTVYIYYGKGRIRLAGLHSAGTEKAVMALGFHGECLIENLTGDGSIDWDRSTGLVVTACGVDKGNVQNNADTSDFAMGWGGANGSVARVRGMTESVGTTTGAAAGAIDIPLTAGSLATLLEGDTILVGGNLLTVTATRNTGAGIVRTSPVLTTISNGTAVQKVQRASAKFIKPMFASSVNGIIVDNADVIIEDPSSVAYTGRRLAWLLNNANVEVSDGELPMIGRGSGGTLNRTFRIEGTSHLALKRLKARNNAAVTSHVQVIGSGSYSVEDCEIENISNFTGASTGWDILSWYGNRDFNGARINHPGQSIAALPLLRIGGADLVAANYSTRTGTLYYFDNGWVEWHVRMALTSKAGLTGTLTIDLPVATSQATRAQVFISTAASLTSIPAGIAIAAAGATMTFNRQATSGTASLTDTQISDTSDINFVVRYKR